MYTNEMKIKAKIDIKYDALMTSDNDNISVEKSKMIRISDLCGLTLLKFKVNEIKVFTKFQICGNYLSISFIRYLKKKKSRYRLK